MIQVRGLRKRYGRLKALDGLALDVPAGAIYGFIGQNGAGKTTTMRILATLMSPDDGEATVGGGGGDLWGWRGERGRGKTRTMRFLAPLMSPDDGEAPVGGADVRREPYEVR